MLLSNERLTATPVMSLQTGAELARTSRTLIDPRALSIIAYQLDGPMLDVEPSFLRVADIRELSNLGFIVDSSDEFVGLDDVIKIKEVYEFEFDLIGLDVIDDKKHKLGKVSGFTVESDGFVVQQLVIKRSLLKSLTEAELLIHRSQVIEVSNQRILVRSTYEKQPLRESVRDYANPFRKTAAQPESIRPHQT